MRKGAGGGLGGWVGVGDWGGWVCVGVGVEVVVEEGGEGGGGGGGARACVGCVFVCV